MLNSGSGADTDDLQHICKIRFGQELVTSKLIASLDDLKTQKSENLRLTKETFIFCFRSQTNDSAKNTIERGSEMMSQHVAR